MTKRVAERLRDESAEFDSNSWTGWRSLVNIDDDCGSVCVNFSDEGVGHLNDTDRAVGPKVLNPLADLVDESGHIRACCGEVPRLLFIEIAGHECHGS